MGINKKDTDRHGFSRLELVRNATVRDLMPETVRVVDASFTAALKVVADVMREGERTHPANDWAQREVVHHIRRAQLHLSMLRNDDPASSEDHLSHALTRLLMAVTLRERARHG